MRHILITGSNGQIGSNLACMLADAYPGVKILCTDLHPSDNSDFESETLDVLDSEKFRQLIEKYEINEIYHLAAILSAAGEKRPEMAWQINFKGLMNVLEIAREFGTKVFWPSSIGVFGKTTPDFDVPQATICEPTTVYGISKFTGEMWCQYYHQQYGIDVRSVRFPGIISHLGEPGGGTTDYAVEIFHKALSHSHYDCFLKADTYLPMLYMNDAIEGVLRLMEAPAESLTIRMSYNISGMSFCPAELAQEIQKHIPDFTIDYKPDYRQAIAESWPSSLDDSVARNDWNWDPKFNTESMVKDMISHLRASSGVSV